MVSEGLDTWRSTSGKYESWMLLHIYNSVLRHTCCSVDVTDVFEVHTLIDDFHLRECCCDVSEELPTSLAESILIRWLIHGCETMTAPGYCYHKLNVGSECSGRYYFITLRLDWSSLPRIRDHH